MELSLCFRCSCYSTSTRTDVDICVMRLCRNLVSGVVPVFSTTRVLEYVTSYRRTSQRRNQRRRSQEVLEITLDSHSVPLESVGCQGRNWLPFLLQVLLLSSWRCFETIRLYTVYCTLCSQGESSKAASSNEYSSTYLELWFDRFKSSRDYDPLSLRFDSKCLHQKVCQRPFRQKTGLLEC